jgi:riboflavin synthase
MFTGIVEELGQVLSIGTGRLTIQAKTVLDDIHLGDSIAVNGICLTVTTFTANSFCVDVMPETIRRTSFASLKNGSAVNLERALTLSSRLGGHIVSGHIDGVGTILSFDEEGNAVICRIKASPELLHYIIEKGSVTLDGISLTVVKVTDQWFSVSLIPHTRSVTAFKERKAGDLINIENDIIGKYVEKFVMSPLEKTPSPKPHGLTKEFLTQYGF